MKAWKRVVIHTNDSAEEIEITHNPEQDCVLFTIKTGFGKDKQTASSYLEYSEARYLASELNKWCDEFEPQAKQNVT